MIDNKTIDFGGGDSVNAKVRLVFRYIPSPNTGEVVRTLVVTENEKQRLESLIRLAFQIPNNLHICVLINGDTICFPVSSLDFTEASHANTLMVQPFDNSQGQRVDGKYQPHVQMCCPIIAAAINSRCKSP